MATRRLSLNARPDGYGYLYGTILDDPGQSHTVNIMPPIPHWNGDLKLSGDGAPHATDWVIYLDGEEIVRAKNRNDLEAAIIKRLPAR